MILRWAGITDQELRVLQDSLTVTRGVLPDPSGALLDELEEVLEWRVTHVLPETKEARHDGGELLLETLLDGTQIFLSASAEADVSVAQEAKLVDDGKGWGKKFARAVRQNVQKFGVWGWCQVEVTARDPSGREGSSYLGCTSESGPLGFLASGYYPQKRQEALDELQESLTMVSGSHVH